ncbi:MAG TPA: universal stress protein [Rubrobacteraceae bacterium]|nr:universal stress protein [Rubrobacteraceae bacterium]
MSIFPARILLATDGSPHAELAALTAVDLAESTGSRLHVVAVARTFDPAVYEVYAEAAREDIRSEAQQILEEQVRKIEAAGGTVTVAHLKMGERRDEAIVHLAEEIGAGLIVMGSRGFGGLKRALLGNVADSVVRHAHCPVMVVRPQRSADSRLSWRRFVPSRSPRPTRE